MSKKKIGLLLLIIIMATGILAINFFWKNHDLSIYESLPEQKELQSYVDWGENYYQHPVPEKTLQAFTVFHENGLINLMKPEMISFFAYIFRDNPQYIRDWGLRMYELTKETLDERALVYQIFFFAEHEDSIQLLQEIKDKNIEDSEFLEALLQQPVRDVLEVEITQAWEVDFIWGAFRVTGNKLYIKKVIALLPLQKNKDDMDKMIVGLSAQFSLKGMGIRHPLVYEVCLEMLQQTEGEEKELLQEVVEDIERESK